VAVVRTQPRCAEPPERLQGVATASFDALGSTATVAVTCPERLSEAVASVQKTVAAFDEACSRFRDDSELQALNAAAGEPVPVGPLLFEAVGAALRTAILPSAAR
jgi:thiamine biosynthesis lipoprotein